MPLRLRIFISSPGDVADERLRAELIIDKLAQDYSRFFNIESYRWEHEPMLASGHFQDAIEPPSAFDIVVLILWSRLGVPLPERTAARDYRGIDGRAPVTGTEWEYEEALRAARENGAPDLLAFRNRNPAPVDTRDAMARARQNAQLDALDRFWSRHFADRGVFLAAYDEYKSLEDFAHQLEASLRKLIARRIKNLPGNASHSQAIWPGNPFRGLESYEFEHASVFFGRDAAVVAATEQLAANAHAGQAFLLISGASGSGKSSLAKAGIVPRLMKSQRISGKAFMRRAVFRPASNGDDIFLGLAKLLTDGSGDANVGLPELIAAGQNADQLAADFRGNGSAYLFANALGRLTEAGRQSAHLLPFEDAKLILVVDQMEELFTIPEIGSDERRLFIQLLVRLARSSAVWVIATLRADFWDRMTGIPEFAEIAGGRGRFDLMAPSPTELTDMIRKPAEAAGLSFEDNLDANLAEQCYGPGTLPLLSFALDELYKRSKERGLPVLTRAMYDDIGGFRGAIAHCAENISRELDASSTTLMSKILLALVGWDPAGGQAVRQSRFKKDLAKTEAQQKILDQLIEARLVVTTGAKVCFVHEALIDGWPRLAKLVEREHEFIEARTRLEERGLFWQRHGRPNGRLLTSASELEEAQNLLQTRRADFNDYTVAYIERSIDYAPQLEKQAADRLLTSLWRAIEGPASNIAYGVFFVFLALLPLLLPSFHAECRVPSGLSYNPDAPGTNPNLPVWTLEHCQPTNVRDPYPYPVSGPIVLLLSGCSIIFGVWKIFSGLKRVFKRGD